MARGGWFRLKAIHRLLFGRTGGGGGQFKTVDNLVVDRHLDGTSSVRFVPTSHQDTPFFTSELVDRYCVEQEAGRHHRVLLVGLFALDFLTVRFEVEMWDLHIEGDG